MGHYLSEMNPSFNMTKTRKAKAKSKRYPTVNAMIRDTMSPKEANDLIDGMGDILVQQNLGLMSALAELVVACTSNAPSGVTCPDKRVLKRARAVAVKYGVVFNHAS